VHDADDVVQETLTRVLAARGGLGDETLTAYAFAVARNLIATQHREAELHRHGTKALVGDPGGGEQGQAEGPGQGHDPRVAEP
jgi:DNA-directed RNA polymerase specialized sigma24 family protein